MPTPLHIAGYSVRAAAWSAWRGGVPCVAIDCFGDRDLRRVACRWHRADPSDWASALDTVMQRRQICGPRSTPPVLCWMAPLENHPDVLERAAAKWRIAGCPLEAVRRVRDPHWLASTAARCGIAFPETVHEPPEDPGAWLFKPLRGGGGMGVRLAGGRAPRGAETAWANGLDTGGLFQRYVPGVPGSAVFLADRDGVRLLGWTRQLVGEAFACAPPFAYCGTVAARPTIAPPRLFENSGAVSPSRPSRPRRESRRWQSRSRTWDAFARGVQRLAREAGLRGLFGADFVFDGERPWLVEINPRYTAAVEVLELLHRRSYFPAHLKAVGVEMGELPRPPGDCGPRPERPVRTRTAARTPDRHVPPPLLAKVVLFVAPPAGPGGDGPGVPGDDVAVPHGSRGGTAVRRTPWDAPESWADPDDPFRIPAFADVPADSAAPFPGGPWMTVFVRGDSPAALWDDVRRRARDAYSALRHPTAPTLSGVRIDEASK